jgi:hypothetical protein
VSKKPVKGGCIKGSDGAEADRRRVAFIADMFKGGEGGLLGTGSSCVSCGGGCRSIGATMVVSAVGGNFDGCGFSFGEYSRRFFPVLRFTGLKR